MKKPRGWQGFTEIMLLKYVLAKCTGGGTGDRTPDKRIKSPLLYQLSYSPEKVRYYPEATLYCQ